MDCTLQIQELQNVYDRLGARNIRSMMKGLRKIDISARMLVDYMRPLMSLLNRPQFIDCIRAMQAYTTDPSWFDLFSDFVINDPTFTERIVADYTELGLSPQFINVLLYSSGRPRVDFKPYLAHIGVAPRFDTIEPYEYIVPPSPLLPLTVADPPDGLLLKVYTPVNRYQLGEVGYLTVIGHEENQWCGTFYYYEPESPFFLYAPRVLVSWNKITACLDLDMDFDTVAHIVYESRKTWIKFDQNDNEIEGYPNNMGFNVAGTTKQEQWTNVTRAYQHRKIDPTIHIPEFYAAEDAFDQPLCLLAAQNQIDVIILKYMTGETRVVTEILDTRDRTASFSNIIFPPRA